MHHDVAAQFERALVDGRREGVVARDEMLGFFFTKSLMRAGRLEFQRGVGGRSIQTSSSRR